MAMTYFFVKEREFQILLRHRRESEKKRVHFIVCSSSLGRERKRERERQKERKRKRKKVFRSAAKQNKNEAFLTRSLAGATWKRKSTEKIKVSVGLRRLGGERESFP